MAEKKQAAKTEPVRDAAGRFEKTTGKGKKPSSHAKHVMRKKVTEAWPDITDILVKTAKEGDFRATKWLWDESGLGQEPVKKRRGGKMGFAQALIEKFKREQAAAEAAKTGTTKVRQ